MMHGTNPLARDRDEFSEAWEIYRSDVAGRKHPKWEGFRQSSSR